MGKTRSRNRRTQATNLSARWTIPVFLLPDESLGSWLVRTALTHGCSPKTLTAWIWPTWRAWLADIDRGINPDRLALLERVSGIDADALRSATLAPIAELIEGSVPDQQGSWKWIIPRGMTGRGHRSSLQYCPGCVVEDRNPYYHLTWRLAWHTTCSAHDTGLCDSCPNCSAKVLPHHLTETAPDACICAACGTSLGDAPRSECDPHALAFQRNADRALRDGSATCLGSQLSRSSWFEVAQFWVSLLRRTVVHPGKSTIDLLGCLGITPPPPTPATPGAGIERLRAGDRQAVLGRVWRIMKADPDSFCEAVRRSAISRQALCDARRPMPEPIAGLLPDLPDNGRTRYLSRTARRRGPRERNEVVRMMDRLTRTLATANK